MLFKGSDDDSIDWGSYSEEESSLSSDDEKYGGNLAAKFLKRLVYILFLCFTLLNLKKLPSFTFLKRLHRD